MHLPSVLPLLSSLISLSLSTSPYTYLICPPLLLFTLMPTSFKHHQTHPIHGGCHRTMAVSRWINRILAFFVFFFLDILDFLLCFTYKALDFIFESEWKPCYCCPPPPAKHSDGSNGGKIIVSQPGEYSKVVSLTRTKIHFDEISNTLYSRPSLPTRLSKLVKCFKGRFNQKMEKSEEQKRRKRRVVTVSSTVVEKSQRVPRWSDCHCRFCTCWLSSSKDSLFVKVQQPKETKAQENVLFIHGFLSSSAFWTETVFPNMSETTKSNYRLIAIDLLGYGRSPKPNDSSYTLREHLEMIERSVISQFRLKSFHLVAHSLGCILALALAVKHPAAVKSLTLLAPPYYAVPKGVEGTEYVMRKVAPKEVWPPIAFGASVASWYEHISRTVSLVLCKNHLFLDYLTRLFTRNRIRTYLIEGFFCHTHNASWHTLHNIIFGTGSQLDVYLDFVRDHVDCDVSIFHGSKDELIPLHCSFDFKRKVPRAKVNVVNGKDHITIVVGRQKEFASELEEIWRKSSQQHD